MPAPRFIALEGLDATGKSSLAAALAEALDAQLLSTPPAALRMVRPIVDDLYRDHGQAAQLFYASTVAWVSDRARELLSQGQHVVVDRYWLSTWAYDLLRPGAIDLMVLERELLPADVTLLLETSDAERRRRLFQRGATWHDCHALPQADALRQRFRDGVRRPIAGRGIVLDTTGCSAIAARDAALELVLQWPLAA